MREYSRFYGQYQLECWDNGLAYALTHLPTKLQVYVQGEDAIKFEEDRDNVENAFPEASSEWIMGYLWDVLDYGSAAVQK